MIFVIIISNLNNNVKNLYIDNIYKLNSQYIYNYAICTIYIA